MPCPTRADPLPEAFKALHRTAKEQFNENNDCSVKAIALACDVPYAEVHARLTSLGRKKVCGTPITISWKAPSAGLIWECTSRSIKESANDTAGLLSL
jgi:hypothetical protein